jgi:hypothetical protein
MFNNRGITSDHVAVPDILVTCFIRLSIHHISTNDLRYAMGQHRVWDGIFAFCLKSSKYDAYFLEFIEIYASQFTKLEPSYKRGPASHFFCSRWFLPFPLDPSTKFLCLDLPRSDGIGIEIKPRVVFQPFMRLIKLLLPSIDENSRSICWMRMRDALSRHPLIPPHFFDELHSGLGGPGVGRDTSVIKGESEIYSEARGR